MSVRGIYTILGLVGSGVFTVVSGAIGVGATSIGVFNTANIATIIRRSQRAHFWISCVD